MNSKTPVPESEVGFFIDKTQPQGLGQEMFMKMLSPSATFINSYLEKEGNDERG